MQYLKDLSKFPTGGFDQLELLIAKAVAARIKPAKETSWQHQHTH